MADGRRGLFSFLIILVITGLLWFAWFTQGDSLLFGLSVLFSIVFVYFVVSVFFIGFDESRRGYNLRRRLRRDRIHLREYKRRQKPLKQKRFIR